MTHYYLPISAFVFPEVAGAEAISPKAGDVAGVFVGRSSYPTSTTGTIPVNPIEEALVLYSSPVTWGYRDGSVMDYPLVIEIPSAWIDEKALVELKLPSLTKGVLAWAYGRTIFFGQEDPMRYIFRTEGDKTQQLNRLLPFKEIKNLERIRAVSDSFERSGLSVSELPDSIADEIKQAVFTLGESPSRFQDDLLIETRCGACLGHAIASAKKSLASAVRIEDSLRMLSGDNTIAVARKITDEIQDRMKQLVRILSDGTGSEYDLLPICVKPVFKFKGRGYQRLWPYLDPIVRQCVDFIAGYPKTNWNWFGNEERFVFVRELWNEILQPTLIAKSPESLDVFRNEVLQICRHFKTPNESAFSLEDVRSPLLQAIYLALDCPRDSEKLELYLKNVHRPDFCLAVFGALRGYAYFSRTMLPGTRGGPPQRPPVAPVEPKGSQPKKEPFDKGQDLKQPVLPRWALKFISMLKAIFSARKIAPKKSKGLMDSFCQATQESGSEDKLLTVLSRKPGWSKRTYVYKDLVEKMSAGGSMKKNSAENDLFEQAASMGACVVTESTDVPFIEDPALVSCLETFLTRTLAMDKGRIDRLLEDARFLQREYAPGGRYAADPVKNPRDNKNTIRHYGNLFAMNLGKKNIPLSDAARDAILRFLAERYK